MVGSITVNGRNSVVVRLILLILLSISPVNAERAFPKAGYLSTNRRNMLSMPSLKLRLMAN